MEIANFVTNILTACTPMPLENFTALLKQELVENVRTNELLLIFYSFISRKGVSLFKDINNMAHDETQLEHGVLQIIFLPVFNNLPLMLMILHLSHLYIASRMVFSSVF